MTDRLIKINLITRIMFSDKFFKLINAILKLNCTESKVCCNQSTYVSFILLTKTIKKTQTQTFQNSRLISATLKFVF